MIDKTCSVSKAIKLLSSDQIIMVGGFGVPGTPFLLIQEIIKENIKELTLIKNEANEAGIGISRLIENGQVKKLITSHLGLNGTVISLMNAGKLEVVFFPQGILAEKIRAGGAGLLAIVTDIGIDTILRENKQVIQCENKEGLLEPALRADFALIHAAKADRAGNLVYEKTARNFNPLMATAASCVIAEAETIVETGEIPPDQIHTPGAFVDHVVEIKELLPDYGVLEHHVR